MRIAIFLHTGVKWMDAIQVEMVLLINKSYIPLNCKQSELTIYLVSLGWGYMYILIHQLKPCNFLYKVKDDKIMRHKI